MSKPATSKSVGADGHPVSQQGAAALGPTPTSTPPEPIAIVGIGCRFPGGVNSSGSFWELLRNGVDAIGSMPLSRFPQQTYDDAAGSTSSKSSAPGKIATRQGGFLNGVENFDAPFFDVSPREAKAMDPQQRLLLETTWEAIQDAGLTRARLAGSNTGVYVGMWTSDYEDTLFAASNDIDLYMTTGGGRYAASGRLSYVFDLQGPSLTVDTACSSSLVAVHLACQSLWSGESEMALAGAVNLILQPFISIGYSRSRMLSPDGRCKFGDAKANGYVRSEGCATLVLKTLSRAQADGDQIYALIRGTAINNDGHSSDLLVTPSGQGQLEIMRHAYAQAGIQPSEVDYVEAHGTGTPVGDPVELQALGAIFAEGRQPDRPCIVGSVKTNIGHTEAASGMAGLIKAALALKHRAIPASLHFETPNPKIPWAALPLKIQRSFGDWPEGHSTHYAGVNSFGVTGTNAHVVLQEAPVPEAAARSLARSDDARAQLLTLSAHSPQALRAAAHDLGAYIAAQSPALGDLAYTLALRREHLSHRLNVVARDQADTIAALRDFADDPASSQPPAATPASAPRIVFVFPGQGSQWVGMAQALLADEPVFRTAIERLDAAIRAAAGWSLLEKLVSDDAAALDEIDVIQPALFAIQVALAGLWRSWGIEPSAVVGHSMGEVATAHIAGALTLEDAVRIICSRSQLLRRVRGQGAMAVVELSFAEAEAELGDYRDRVAVAVSNAPRSTVISGDPAAVEAIITRLQSRDIFCRPVKVDVASHSPQMDPLLEELDSALSKLTPSAAQVPIYSTVDAARVDGANLNADYWVRNLRQPVKFSQVVQQLIADGHTCFIEISPHPILLPAVQQMLQQAGERDSMGMALASMRRNEPARETMLTALGALHVAGAQIVWAQVVPSTARQITLPTYPWQRERFWFEPTQPRSPVRTNTGHPLLGEHFRPANSTSQFWETTLDLGQQAYLKDHQPRGTVLFPATGFVEMMLVAVAEAHGTGSHRLENLTLSEALVLSTDAPPAVQVELAPHQPGSIAVRIYSAAPTSGAERDWQLHAEAVVHLDAAAATPEHATPTSIQAHCTAELEPDDFYQELASRELVYGPAFRTIQHGWRAEGEMLGQLHSAASAPNSTADHITLLDGGLQLAVAALASSQPNVPYLPVGIDHLQVHAWPTKQQEVWGHAVVTGRSRDQVVCDVVLIDTTGQVLAEIGGLHLQPVARAQSASLSDLLFELQWLPQPLPASTPQTYAGRWLVLDGNGLGETLATRLASQGAQCTLVQPGTHFSQLGPNHYALDPANADELRSLLQATSSATGGRFSGIIHAWSLAATLHSDTDLAAAQELCAGSIVNLVQALVSEGETALPRLWLLTSGAQTIGDAPVSLAPAQALTWGIGRTLANEHPELHCTLIDLDPSESVAAQVAQLERELGSIGIDSNGAEDQIAWRNGTRYVARLAAYQAPAIDTPAQDPNNTPWTTGENQPYRLVASAPGSLDSLQLQPLSRRAPGPGEIEVRVEAAGLNFIDVLKAMAIYPGLEPSPEVALGAECAGTVVAIGPDVTTLAVGDRVTVITSSYTHTSCLSAFVTLPAAFAAPTPASLTQTEAAGMPLVFMTAYYALHELGRLRAGERVLIHAAASGVGLAAIQLCQRAGAIIFATAGSPAKREFLRSLGVQHIYDSRTLDFAEQIIADTNGRGVDLVLNSLSGAAIPRSLDVLAPRGRFLEIGKRDIYADSHIGLSPFRKNLSFFAIDLAGWTAEDPAGVSELFQTVMGLVAAGELQPLPSEHHPISAAADAFRNIAQARHIGKIVLELGDEAVQVTPMPSAHIHADATYLITGGLGGLGLAMAEWLVKRGARHLALMARSTPSPTAQQAIAKLEADGAQLRVLAADVTDASQLAVALSQIAADMPPLRGIVHTAGVLADATLANMDHEQLLTALRPKVHGAWNLHTLTQSQPLDFFAMFSSVVALLGLPGQANYAAGNAFMDALAHQRRRNGLKALSINWGPWSGVGLAAAERNRGERLAGRGLGSLSPDEGLAAFEQLLRADATQATVMHFDPQRWAAASHTSPNTLLTGLGTPQATPSRKESTLRAAVLEADTDKSRRTVLETFVRTQLAQVLHIAPNRIDGHKPLKTMGLDSLMALELRNLLEAGSGLTLSATLAWNYPTVTAIAAYLADLLSAPRNGNAQTIPTQIEIKVDVPIETIPSTGMNANDQVDNAGDAGNPSADDDDLEAMLNAELAAAERLLGRK